MLELIAKLMFLALVAFGATTSKAQLLPERSGQEGPPAARSGAMPMPRSGVAGDLTQSLEAQRPAWEAYQRCIRENDQAFKLSSITRSLIDARNGKDRYIALLNDPNAPARFKQKSYDESVAEGMAEYRRLGGTARSIEEITPLPNPCADLQPGPKPPSRGGESRSSISASASVTPVPTDARPATSASQNVQTVGTPDGAKWFRLDESFASVIYVDPTSIKKVPRTDRSDKDEDIRQATEMIDLKIKAPGGPSSYITTGEHDCKTGKTRYRSGNAYAGPTGSGRIINAITPSDWPPQPPKSPAPVLRYVCSKEDSTTTKAATLPSNRPAPVDKRPDLAQDNGGCVIKPVMTNAEMAKCR